MQTKPLALALAVAAVLAVGAGGIAVAEIPSPDVVQPHDDPDQAETPAYDERQTADESFETQKSEENITVVGEPTRLTADESFRMQIPEDAIQSNGDGTYRIDVGNRSQDDPEAGICLEGADSPCNDKVTNDSDDE